MNYDNLASQVEAIVRNHVGLDMNTSLIGTKKGDCIKAKHLSIFVLHTIYHVPISWLSKYYSIGHRQTFRLISQIRNYIKYNSSYRDECNSLVKLLEPYGVTRQDV